MQPPFVGPSYNLESRPASVQRTVNMVPVPMEPGNERAGWGLEDVPGLVRLLLDESGGEEHGCYVTENFSAPLAERFTTISGNGALFTIVSGALSCASQNSAEVALIRRSFALVTATRIVLRFRLDDLAGDDDAAVLILAEGATLRFFVIPRREATIDPLNRCHITLLGETVTTPSALAVSTWYELIVELADGAGNTTWTLTNVATSALVASGSFAGDFVSFDCNRLEFMIDSAGTTCATSYDDVCVGF